MTINEIFGYGASVVILVSFLLKNVRNLRIVNTIGCALFVVNGITAAHGIIWPIVITNVGIILVNLYYLLIKRD
jgi:hypothetical protein